MKIYNWKAGARFNVDPQPIGEAIARLKSPTAAEIVEAAENERNALHELFEWDDSEAAHQYRLETAQKVARNLTVEVKIADKEPFEMRAFEIVSQGPHECKQYVPVLKALAKEEWRDEIVARIKGELETAQKQLRTYSYVNENIGRAADYVDSAVKELVKV